MDIKKRTGDKVVEHYGSKDAYKLFKKDHPKTTVKSSEFYKIVEEFNTTVVHKMVFEAFEFYMPGRLSFLRIRKRKIKLWFDKNGKLETKHLKLDFKATKELWQEDPEAAKIKKPIFHLNSHTNGYYAKFFWDKYGCKIRNRQAYEFQACRAATRTVAAAMNSGEVDFYE